MNDRTRAKNVLFWTNVRKFSFFESAFLKQ